MSEETGEPFIGPAEQRLFEIADTRERADELLTQLTPKIASTLDWACGEIKEAYGENSLDPYRIVLTPANRKKAIKTKEYQEASAGLAIRKQNAERQHWYFQQRLECSRSDLRTRIFGLRGREAAPLITVLQRHRDEAARLLEHINPLLWQDPLDTDQEGEEQADDQYDPLLSINRLWMSSERDWRAGVYIEGLETTLPLPDEDAAWSVVYDFVALFPIFRAATDILLGLEDRFPTYVRQFWAWDATLEEGETTATSDTASDDNPPADDFATEGDRKIALRQHFTRERGLRKKKIREALRLGDGRLRCEVPGCGFDFFEVYGELGKHFAHVHHLTPFSVSIGPRRTRLSELAIVCANCHAMIHRGSKCRPLGGLIPGRT